MLGNRVVACVPADNESQLLNLRGKPGLYFVELTWGERRSVRKLVVK
jgi:hypothetical protein